MKIKVYIAVIPQDYSSAEVELFYAREDAEQFIQDWAIRGETHYCFVREEEVVFNRKQQTIAKP